MRFISFVTLLVVNISSFAEGKSVKQVEETLTGREVKVLEKNTSQDVNQKKKLVNQVEKKITTTDVKALEKKDIRSLSDIGSNKVKYTKIEDRKCKPKEVLVTIHNTSNDEMYFEDSTKKIALTVDPKTNKTLCLDAGDVIDGYVTHVTIEKERLPVRQLMWYTKSLDIDIDEDGHIHVEAKTKPHEERNSPTTKK